MNLRDSVIRHLADGRCHSGEELASGLGVTRSAVWKHVHSLEEVGLAVEAVAGKGYRLVPPLDLLDADEIRALLAARDPHGLIEIQVFPQLDSTNRTLLDDKPPVPGSMRVCIAEYQTEGRGRRGRSWVAPFASCLCLSAAWVFDDQPDRLSALSLAVGVICARTLTGLGANDIELKWPNDLLWHGKKLGGILVEMTGEMGGPARFVIGTGINCSLPPGAIDDCLETGALAPTDLTEICRGGPPSRNLLAAELSAGLFAGLEEFNRTGFDTFRDEWLEFDALAGREIDLIVGSQTVAGIAAGVDAGGALCVDVGNEIRRFVSGEARVRARD